ncbi:MAG TPA: hypothetical protein VMS31_06830 [Pyrinomonadaceae bacterium]|nr:hypothetical protein [Pyrinomonadaceae bacterium]
MRQTTGSEFSALIDTNESGIKLRGSASSRWIETLLSSRRLLVVVFMLVIFAGAVRPVTDPDFWWHLKTGQLIAESGGIPHSDIFSSVFLGREWVTHEWLSELFIYEIYRVFGLSGLVLVFSLIITAGFWIAYKRSARHAGHPYVPGFALILGGLTAAPTWGVRPQMFSFLFASVYVAILGNYSEDEKSRPLWWLVPLMVIWVNMHAGFAMGPALIFLTIAGLILEGILSKADSVGVIWRRVRPLIIVGFLCGAAIMINPHGARMYWYPFETLRSHAMMKYIEEWLSPNFQELMFQPFVLMMLATFSVLALSSKRIRVLELFLLLATAAGALRSARNIPFFVLIAMPLLVKHSWNWTTAQRWGRWLTKPEKREVGSQALLKTALNLVMMVALPLGLCVLRLERSVANQPAAEAKVFPVAAVEFMRTQRPPQPIFNDYGWGGYLIWKLYPDYRVYIDGRADVYGDAFMEEFLSAQSGQTGWRGPLEKYGIRTVLIKPDLALASLLRQDASWQNVFEDQQSVIFVRK